MTTYDLGYEDSLESDEAGEFSINTDGNIVWVCIKKQIPKLVAALRDLGHIADPPPEPLRWYTVERHGQPKLEQLTLVWQSVFGAVQVARASADSDHPWLGLSSDARYLPLSALRGHTELPGWGDVAPAPEPELPAPWLAVSDEGEDEYDFLACFAFALEDGRVVVGCGRRQQPSDAHVIAWCPIHNGESVPPHPYARAET